ncbi:PilZ domain-containing protein [Erythrobacter sp. NFXS35]|uniref:PilZ domain-containing protein n=1 Tax=Erythrobacter sp. NFXS35 TaxID=2818436 RepID=UPI0032DEF5C4
MSGFGRKRSALAPREKRRAERLKASSPAFVETPASREAVTVVDFSATGARVIGSCLPPSRRDVWLNVDGLALFGTIVWRKDYCFGIRFDESVNQYNPDDVKRALEQAELYATSFDREAVLQEILRNTSSICDPEEELAPDDAESSV